MQQLFEYANYIQQETEVDKGQNANENGIKI
jgi:hypothetical protein